jgi:hypothetical protein
MRLRRTLFRKYVVGPGVEKLIVVHYTGIQTI